MKFLALSLFVLLTPGVPARGGTAAAPASSSTIATQTPGAAGQTAPPATPEPATPQAASPTAPGATTSGVVPASMPPDQVRALLYKVYMAAFRVSDLLSVLDASKLTMSDAGRKALNQTVSSLGADLASLEKSRAEFYNYPDHLQAGEETNKLLSALPSKLTDFADDLARGGDAPDAALYRKSAEDLANLQKTLEPYVLMLQAGAGQLPLRPVPEAPGLQTETVTVPQNAAPLSYTTPAEAGPGYLKPADVKALLYKVYVAAYRVSDLLSVLHPGGGDATEAQRQTLAADAQGLAAALQRLEQWRGQFNEQPDSMYLAFQTYAALEAVGPRVGEVGQAASKFVNLNLGTQYEAPRRQLADLDQQLAGYVGYLIAHQHQTVAALEDNLAHCQSTLGYALMPRREPAAPMKNIVPEFKGRRVRRHPGKPATHAEEKKKPERTHARTTSGR